LFVTADLGQGADIGLSAEQAHYLDNVMRRRVGDALHVFNGRDGEWQARVHAIGRRTASLRAEIRLRAQDAEPGPWLLFAPLKRDATDLVVQKATELGVSAILPVMTERTNAARVNESRLTAIAIEAAEQSERLTVPVIHPPRRLAAALDDFPLDRRLFIAAERADAPHLRGCPEACALLVGPEGGFAPSELDGFQQYPFAVCVNLGPRILRAETACLAGLALLQAPGCG
jgi:16S rRNA (uracil1498-N3)-methyltransferase